MTTIGYCRVSTAEQAREGMSMEAQETRIRAYCEIYDLGPVEIVKDNGKSAATLRRAGMEYLLERILKKAEQPVTAVVVYKLDRMFRNLLDGLHTLETFKAHGVAFHSVLEKWDTSTSMGEFALNMMLALAQLERRQIGERTRDTLQATKKSPGGSPVLDDRKENGKLVMGQAPYGLRWEGEGADRKLVLVPEEMEVVQGISAMRDWEPRNIVKHLADRQITQRNGKPFSERMVRTILGRGYYRGYFT